MLLLTTAMKPLSAWTTPRRLIAPISRHFLPVLQPEPPAWLTTGLMKGSRLPLALFLLVWTVCSSEDAASAAGAAARLAATGASSLGAGVGAGLCPTKTAPPCLAWSLLFAFAECTCTGAEGAKIFAGGAAALPFALAGAGLVLAVAAAGLLVPTAPFEAAAAFPLTAFILSRVVRIMLGLWAEAKPAASTQIKIVTVGFVFILSLLFLHRWSGLGVHRTRCQVVTEIRGGQASRHHTLTGCVLVDFLRLRGGWNARRCH